MLSPILVQTGAASGIGQSTAQLFGRKGYNVVLADRSVDLGRSLAEKIRQAGGEAAFIKLEITDESSVQAIIHYADEKYGRIDCAVNCAGIGGPSLPGELEGYSRPEPAVV